MEAYKCRDERDDIYEYSQLCLKYERERYRRGKLENGSL